MSAPALKHVVEAALFAAGRPLTLDDLLGLFATGELRPDRAALREALAELSAEWAERGVELVEVASGHRFQVRRELGAWMAPLWAERPPRYSRALLETLALVAYRQPITRAEIEEVRGVSVSSSIVKTLVEREWIRVLGPREVPGRPALYGTTREFLDAFGLKRLDDLPPLSELTDLDQMGEDLFSSLPGGVREDDVAGADDGAPDDESELVVPAQPVAEDALADEPQRAAEHALADESESGVPAQPVAEGALAPVPLPGSAVEPAPESASVRRNDGISEMVSAGADEAPHADGSGKQGGTGR